MSKTQDTNKKNTIGFWENNTIWALAYAPLAYFSLKYKAL